MAIRIWKQNRTRDIPVNETEEKKVEEKVVVEEEKQKKKIKKDKNLE
jgi:hypothetical protein